MITEVEIIKHLVLNQQDFKYELESENDTKSQGKLSVSRMNKFEKEMKNQLFQTIYIQWGAYVKELKKQIKEQQLKGPFVFDSKIAGKLLVKDGEVKILQKDDEIPLVEFDFEKVCDQIGVSQEQMVQNLTSYMQSAQDLMQKNPQKKFIVDLQFSQLELQGNLKPIAPLEYSPYDARETKSVRSSLSKKEFGMFKRNPSIPQSQRSSALSSYGKIQKKLKVLNKPVQSSFLDMDDCSVQTPKSNFEKQKLGLRTAASTGGFMHKRNQSQTSMRSIPRSVQITQLDPPSNRASSKLLNNRNSQIQDSFSQRRSSNDTALLLQDCKPNFVPWEYRRNPITGIQYTQKMRETSNDWSSPRVVDKSAPPSMSQSFSFNAFILQNQPEAQAYPTQKRQMETQNSITVVENAMAQFKQKLREKKQKQIADTETHFKNIEKANQIYKEQQRKMREQRVQISDYNYNKMFEQKANQKADERDKFSLTKTCFVTSDLDEKIEKIKKIQVLKTKLNKECVELQVSNNKEKKQKSIENMRETQRIFNQETENLVQNEKLAHSQRKNQVQEQNRAIWEDQRSMHDEKKELMKGGYIY